MAPFERGELFGHNILNFDLPFLAKRMAINGMGDYAVVLKLRERYWHTDLPIYGRIKKIGIHNV